MTQKRKIKPSKKALEALAAKSPVTPIVKRRPGRPRKVQETQVRHFQSSSSFPIVLIMAHWQDPVDQFVTKRTKVAKKSTTASAKASTVVKKVRFPSPPLSNLS